MSIIDPADEEALLSADLITSAYEDGTRRIHKRRLNSLSDQEYQNLPLASASSMSSSDYYHTIPDILISRATLEYLGYTEARSRELWETWMNWPPDEPKRESDDIYHGVPFIDFATGHVGPQYIDTADDDDSTWNHCLNRCGIAAKTQLEIMDPVFKDIRLTESCLFWVKDTMMMRYRGLQAIQQTSRKRTMAARSQRNTSGSQQTGSSVPGDDQRRSIPENTE
ncbi:hypothetical protein F4819DRAFT_231879 [Hypoxylon fuscum]|nr:hypothetical protein F4819DRAFT_231879 [Hypoxylon fuscum]